MHVCCCVVCVSSVMMEFFFMCEKVSYECDMYGVHFFYIFLKSPSSSLFEYIHLFCVGV